MYYTDVRYLYRVLVYRPWIHSVQQYSLKLVAARTRSAPLHRTSVKRGWTVDARLYPPVAHPNLLGPTAWRLIAFRAGGKVNVGAGQPHLQQIYYYRLVAYFYPSPFHIWA